MQKNKEKNVYLPIFILIFSLNALTAALLSPLYLKTATDILYSDSLMPQILSFFIEFLNVIALFCGYGAVIFSVLSIHKKSTTAFAAIALGGVLFNFAISFIFDYFAYAGGMPLEDSLHILLYFGVNFALEFAKIVVIIVFTRIIFKSERHSKNALCISAIFASVLFLILATAAELPVTISFLKEFGATVRPNEIVSIVYAYASILIKSVIGYFVISYLSFLFNPKRY